MSPRLIPLARLVNLLAPGAGLIIVGHVTAGLAIGLGFAICANVAIACNWIVPLESPALLRALSLVAAGLLYVVAQGLFPAAARDAAGHNREVDRKRALIEVRKRMKSGEIEEAWKALSPWFDDDPDLLTALRAAQILTALGHEAAAREALATLRRLDKHHICRAECAVLEERLGIGASLHNPAAADAVSAATGR